MKSLLKIIEDREKSRSYFFLISNIVKPGNFSSKYMLSKLYVTTRDYLVWNNNINHFSQNSVIGVIRSYLTSYIFKK
jgi:hypothetical protein